MYIAFEGIDGVGKSTQINLLKSALDARDISAIYTKEPGGIDLGIRELVLGAQMSAKARLMMFLADRAEHYERIIAPHQSTHIITDRSYISGIAYALDDFDFEFLRTLNEFCMSGARLDGVVFLRASRQLVVDRLKSRGNKLDMIEKSGIDYLLRVQENILDTLKRLEVRTLELDASLPKDILSKQILSFVLELA